MRARRPASPTRRDAADAPITHIAGLHVTFPEASLVTAASHGAGQMEETKSPLPSEDVWPIAVSAMGLSRGLIQKCSGLWRPYQTRIYKISGDAVPP